MKGGFKKSKFGVRILIFLVFISALLLIIIHSVQAEEVNIVVEPAGYTNIDRFKFNLTEDIPGAVRYQYRTGADDPETGWKDTTPPLSKTIVLPNETYPYGRYQDGENYFYFRALDINDEIIPINNQDFIVTSYFYNTQPPNSVQNLTVSPNESEYNNFYISWDLPEFYVGDPNKIKYHYSINQIPSAENTQITTNRYLEASSYATKNGTNIIFVVAEDEAGNIDYATYAMETFEINSEPPPSPQDVSIDDISSKDTNQYRLAISWKSITPKDPDNFNGYDIYHSLSNTGPFAKIASVPKTTTSYVHTNLEANSLHYYYVVATNKTQNQSAQSEIFSKTANGRYSTPPKITQEPRATAKTYSAEIAWVTSREANSYVSFGENLTLENSYGNGLKNYTTDHKIIISNLKPDKTYYYKVQFTDPDGNTGESSIGSFKTRPTLAIEDIRIEDLRNYSFIIKWKTNEPARGSVIIGTSQSYGQIFNEEGVYNTTHSLKISGLFEGTLYHYQILQYDLEGNTHYSPDKTLVTLPLPKIINEPEFKVARQDETSNSLELTVSYQTNIDTSTKITYQREDTSQLIFENKQLTKKHQATISGILPNSKYKFQISGNDSLDNQIVPLEVKFQTPRDTIAPKLKNTRKNFNKTNDSVFSFELIIDASEPVQAEMHLNEGIGIKNEFLVFKTNDFLENQKFNIALPIKNTPYTYEVIITDKDGNTTKIEPEIINPPQRTNTIWDVLQKIFYHRYNWLLKLIGL